MRHTTVLAIIIAICANQAGCSDSGNGQKTPDQLYDACIAVFERKGGPAELATQMCDDMRKACEIDAAGEACQKAQRMVNKG